MHPSNPGLFSVVIFQINASISLRIKGLFRLLFNLDLTLLKHVHQEIHPFSLGFPVWLDTDF